VKLHELNYLATQLPELNLAAAEIKALQAASDSLGESEDPVAIQFNVGTGLTTTLPGVAVKSLLLAVSGAKLAVFSKLGVEID